MNSTSDLARSLEALHPRPLTPDELAVIADRMAALAHRLRAEDAARRLEVKR